MRAKRLQTNILGERQVSMSKVRRATHVRALRAVLAAGTTAASLLALSPGAHAQLSPVIDTSGTGVVVDLSVLEDNGVGRMNPPTAGFAPRSVGEGGLLMPGPRMPHSQLHVAPVKEQPTSRLKTPVIIPAEKAAAPKAAPKPAPMATPKTAPSPPPTPKMAAPKPAKPTVEKAQSAPPPPAAAPKPIPKPVAKAPAPKKAAPPPPPQPQAAPKPPKVPAPVVAKAPPPPPPAMATSKATPKPKPAPKVEAKPAAEAKPEPVAKPAPKPAPVAKAPEPTKAAPPPPVVAKAPPAAPTPKPATQVTVPLPVSPTTNTQTAARTPSAAVKSSDSMRVTFEAGDAKLPADAKEGLANLAKMLAGQKSLRLRLKAYAGGEDMSSSKARRLSLSRALSVRSYLIEQGVRSTRIDVRALGNKTSEEPVNRVDLAVIER